MFGNQICLVTKYEDGKCSINPHSDDEPCIDSNSKIYTISFGSTRVLNMYTVSGDFRKFDLELKHGMVHTMSRASQDIWRHGIDREPEVSNMRISFTFRHIHPVRATDTDRGTKVDIPPAAKPVPPPAVGSTAGKRVLFLTDSIHSSTPEYIFKSIPGYTCVKRINYQFTDVLKFEPYFKGTDTVILSSGINDLSRYGHTAKSLADTIFPELEKCCRRNSKTKFIFNTILHANYKNNHIWLNEEIDLFNLYMSSFCRNIPNMFYFDSHSLLGQSNIRRVWDPMDKNGIHITLDARKLVTRELVNCVHSLASSPYTSVRSCRWLLFHRDTPRWL